MVVYFLTRQKEICEQMGKLLAEKNHVCTIFTDVEHFYASVKVQGARRIDLLAVDYRSFEHDVLNPYEIMIDHDCVIPFIYYNDPYPEPDERIAFWKVQNRHHFGAVLPESRLDEVSPVLSDLNVILENPELNPCISLINKPLPFYRDEKEKALAQFDIDSFRLRHRIPESRITLFTFLYERQGTSVDSETLCRYLWNDFSKEKLQLLYAYIYDLRAACKMEKTVVVRIEHDGKKQYRLTVTPVQTVEQRYTHASDYFERTDKQQIVFNQVSQEYIDKYKKHSLL